MLHAQRVIKGWLRTKVASLFSARCLLHSSSLLAVLFEQSRDGGIGVQAQCLTGSQRGIQRVSVELLCCSVMFGFLLPEEQGEG